MVIGNVGRLTRSGDDIGRLGFCSSTLSTLLLGPDSEEIWQRQCQEQTSEACPEGWTWKHFYVDTVGPWTNPFESGQKKHKQGFFSRVASFLSSRTDIRCVVVGPKGSGKTTIRYKYKTGITLDGESVPTCVTIEYRSSRFFLAEGTTDRLRNSKKIWDQIDVVVLVIDSTATNFTQVKEAVEIFKEIHQTSKKVSLLCFANKQDLPTARGISEIVDSIQLHNLQDISWYVQGTCACTGDGLYEGLDWMEYTVA